ncbi:MAG: M36 family metallopeptidase, partial [Myxococcales bacterium]|nr:M36 family metallopeptidase [Myxococcales bacterium]
AGKIALIDRGNCTFEVKVNFAEQAGAVGAVIADNVEAPSVLNPGNDGNTADPTIPTFGTTLAEGLALKAALKAPQTAHMQGESSVERDGTIDNMIVAHEWGHYIHHRLVDCSSPACGAESEGWGDFNALFTALREGDDLDGVYALSLYAAFDPTGYFGIRRLPYTVDFARNGFTYRHISDGEAAPMAQPIEPSGAPNSEVHNAGEVWATMMWEAYIALHKAHAEVGDLDFAGVRRRLGDIVVAGMILAPESPTFLEQRDALLMAAAAIDPADFTTIAAAFARRGAGSCAISPPKHSIDFSGLHEDFQVRANGVILGADVDDSLASCDGDGVLDVGELGRVELRLYNAGALPVPAGALVEVFQPDPALVFPDGPSVLAPALDPLGSATVTIPVSLAAIQEYRPLTLTLRITTPDGCQEFQELPLATVVHADLKQMAARDDNFEVTPSAWTIDGGNGDGVWHHVSGPDTGFYWHADDTGRVTDTRLVSPSLQVAPDRPLIIAFDHAYSFEASMGTFWDGAVVEVLVGKSKQWVDISTLAAVTGYTGVLASEENPLNGRSAYAGESPGYPAMISESLNLTDQLAGETIVLRFRVGTDAAAGAPGWDIDNIRISGIDNNPFPVWKVDNGVCAETDASAGDTASSSGDTGQGPTGDPTTGEPTPTEASAGTTAQDTGDEGVNTAVDSAGALDDDGCGCRHTADPRPLLALPLLLLLRRRRRA